MQYDVFDSLCIIHFVVSKNKSINFFTIFVNDAVKIVEIFYFYEDSIFLCKIVNLRRSDIL